MTIDDVLLCSDHDIVRSGQMTVLVAKEYRRITGNEPSACDCQTKNYLRIIRQYYSTTMANDVYYDGRYYDKSTITEEEKKHILDTNPTFYRRLFGSLPEIPEITPEKVKRTRKK